jgi:Ca2+-binding RTX toxin-like protein
VVVTDTELVSAPIVVNIERILPTFTDSTVSEDDPAWTNNNEYFFKGQDESFNEANDGAIRGADLLNIAQVTNFESIDFTKSGDGDELTDLKITFTHGPKAVEPTDYSQDIQPTDSSSTDEPTDLPEVVLTDSTITLANQFAIPSDIEGETLADYRIEYLRFAEGAEFKGYVLNSSVDYEVLDETGVYRIQAGAEGSHCQDLLVSHAGSVIPATLNGYDGNDLLFAYGLNDTLNGGYDDDLLVAHDTENNLNGEDGHDTLLAYGAKSSLNGGAGNDTLFAYSDENTLNGGDGIDTLTAYGNNSSLSGGAGNDSLEANDEYNHLDGGDGDDVLTAHSSYSTLNGGAGEDTLTAKGDYSALDGGDGIDTLTAKGYESTLNGGAGHDTLYAYGEGSILDGGDGDDTLHVNANDAEVNGGTGNDSITLADGVSGTSLILKDNGDSNFDTINNFNESSTIHLNGFVISFNQDHDNEDDGVEKINLDELDAFLKSDDLDISYLITVNGSDSDIWYVNQGVDGVTLDKVAHFVDFDFYNYSAASAAVIPV